MGIAELNTQDERLFIFCFVFFINNKINNRVYITLYTQFNLSTE